MANEKASFREFLTAVEPKHRAFVEKLNYKLIEQGCNLVIKEVKSGYAASYQLEEHSNELGVSEVGCISTDLR